LQDTDPGIYNNLGLTYLALKNEAAAIEQFKTAIKIDPENLEANLNLGYIALNSGDYELARRSFETLAKKYPGNVDIQMGYAICLRGMQEFDEAEKLYDALIARHPTNRTLVLNAITLQYKYRGNFKKAQKLLEDYLKVVAGTISPSDEIFKLKDEIDAAEVAKKKADEEEAARIAAAKAAEEAAKKLLESLKAQVATMEKDIASLQGQGCAPAENLEMLTMVVEQVKEGLNAEDALSSAQDLGTFLKDAELSLAELKAACGGGTPDGGAPAPEGGTPPAPDGGAPVTPPQ
jgi:Flp pilus assembly protein TadD